MQDKNDHTGSSDSRTPKDQSEGKSSTERLQEAAGQVGQAVKENYRDLRDEALEQGHEALDGVRHQAEEYADSRRRSAADDVAAIAKALRAGARELNDQEKPAFAEYSEIAAGGVDDLSAWLRSKSLRDLWHEAETYARQQPAVAFGGAVTAGFILARFLKSSHQEAARDDPDPYRQAPRNRPASPRDGAPAGASPQRSTHDPIY